MRRTSTQQHRTGWLSGEGASAYRADSGRPGHGREARKRTASASNRRRRRPLLFFAVVASVAGTFAAVFADIVALVAIFAVVGLLLSAVVMRAEG